MDGAIWGFIGVIVGAVLAGLFDLFRDKALIGERDRERGAIAAKTARDERKQAYVQLLVAARQLRYAARPETAIERDRIEALKADLSSAQYVIELLAPAELVASGDHLRRAVLDYVDDAAAGTETERNLLRRRARLEVEHFTLLAKADLA